MGQFEQIYAKKLMEMAETVHRDKSYLLKIWTANVFFQKTCNSLVKCDKKTVTDEGAFYLLDVDKGTL